MKDFDYLRKQMLFHRIVECCFDKSFIHYKKDEEIRKIVGIPLDK